MRLALTLCLVSALVILAGCCGSGGCGVAKAPAASAPTAYGSASGARVVYERAPAVTVREVARPAPSYERRLSRFTPPAAPAIPAARKAARRSYPAPAPSVCEPVIDPCKPVDPCATECVGGNCGVPSLDPCATECVGGNCGIPSLKDLFNPCK